MHYIVVRFLFYLVKVDTMYLTTKTFFNNKSYNIHGINEKNQERYFEFIFTAFHESIIIFPYNLIFFPNDL